MRQSTKGIIIMAEIGKKSYIGIDVSKEMLDVYISLSQSHNQFSNDEVGWNNLIKCIGQDIELCVAEATGGYEKGILKHLMNAGIKTKKVNPKRVRDFAKGMGVLAKTDKVDAKILARYAQLSEIEADKGISEQQEKLKAFELRRQTLVSLLTAEKTRLKKTTDNELIEQINKSIEFIESQLKILKERLSALIKDDKDLEEKAKQLERVPSIGPITSIALLGLLPELGKLSNKKIAMLAGLAPINRDSGSKTGKRHIGGGRAEVRKVFYMAALTAIRYNKVCSQFYERLLEKGKAKKVALIAVMRKLLMIVNTLIRTGSQWRELAN